MVGSKPSISASVAKVIDPPGFGVAVDTPVLVPVEALVLPPLLQAARRLDAPPPRTATPAAVRRPCERKRRRSMGSDIAVLSGWRPVRR